MKTEIQQQAQRRHSQQHRTRLRLRRQHQQRHCTTQNKATISLKLAILLLTISIVVATQQLSPRLQILQEEDERRMRHRSLENLKDKPEKADKKNNKKDDKKDKCKNKNDCITEIPSAMPSPAPSKLKPTSQNIVEVANLPDIQYKGEDMVHGLCEGDCDSHDQCAGNLKCFFRSAWEVVPGCKGIGPGEKDFCYDPLAADPNAPPSPSSAPSSSPTITAYPSTWSPSASSTWSLSPPTVSSAPTRAPSSTDAPTKSPAPSSAPSVTAYPSTWSPSPSATWADTSSSPTVTNRPTSLYRPSASPSTSPAPTPSSSPSSTWSPSPSSTTAPSPTTAPKANRSYDVNDVNVEFSFAIGSSAYTPSPSPSSTWSPTPTIDEGGSFDVVGNDFGNLIAARAPQMELDVAGSSTEEELLENVIVIVSDLLRVNTGYEIKNEVELSRRISIVALQETDRRLLADIILVVDREQSFVEEIDTSNWSDAEKASLREQGITWYNVNINYNVTSSSSADTDSATDGNIEVVIPPLDLQQIKGNVEQAVAGSIEDGSLAKKLGQYDDRIQAVSEEGKEEETNSVVFAGNNGVQVSSTQGGFDNLDPSFGEPIRITGICMFFVTLFATAFIIYVAKNRKHKKKISEEWKAYLASEDEIERMLSHGIVSPITEGSGVSDHAPTSSLAIKVFDKEEKGYNNENSMLMGGHQYTPEMAVMTEQGVEVKVEHF